MLEKQEKRQKRHKKIRAKVFGTHSKPRLSVFRSAKHIYVQLVDDEKRKTLLSASDLKIKKSKSKGKTTGAFSLGKLIAEKALEKKIEKVVFDRGGYKYHGRIKAVAEGAREGGLKF